MPPFHRFGLPQQHDQRSGGDRLLRLPHPVHGEAGEEDHAVGIAGNSGSVAAGEHHLHQRRQGQRR